MHRTTDEASQEAPKDEGRRVGTELGDKDAKAEQQKHVGLTEGAQKLDDGKKDEPRGLRQVVMAVAAHSDPREHDRHNAAQVHGLRKQKGQVGQDLVKERVGEPVDASTA